MKNKGLIHIYTGDGKGKTTAAAGLSIRALAQGKTVLFCQFLKGQDSGEILSLKKLGATVVRPEQSGKFYPTMSSVEKAKCEQIQREVFNIAASSLFDYDMVVLDEIFACLSQGILNQGEVLNLIGDAKGKTELVLTGRNPPAVIQMQADYISAIHAVRHPYDRGVAARKGFEY